MQIPLTRGRFTVVDEEDYDLISSLKWRVDGQGYVSRGFRQDTGKVLEISLHRFLTKAEKGYFVDHINGDRLDNRKSNLRIVTKSQNTFNKGKHRNTVSQYKGVTWQKSHKKWMSKIGYDKKVKYLGSFDSELEAAKAYNKAAIELFGDYAKLNQLEASA